MSLAGDIEEALFLLKEKRDSLAENLECSTSYGDPVVDLLTKEAVDLIEKEVSRLGGVVKRLQEFSRELSKPPDKGGS